MYSKFFQRLRHQACVVLFGIALISACTVSAGAVVLHESGDGMCFYNWVVAPELPTYRPGNFMYSAMGVSYPEGMDPFTDYLVGLFYFDDQIIYEDGSFYLASPDFDYEFNYIMFYYTPSETIASLLGGDPGEWILAEEASASNLSTPLNWSDYMVEDSSGAVVCSPSTPISLDGFELIRWDGDRSSTDISNSYAYISSALSVPTDAYCVLGTINNNIPSYSRGTTSPSSGVTVDGSSWSMVSGNVSYVKSDSVSDSLLFYAPTPVFGIGSFTQLLAYKPDIVPIGPDFSQTSLSASNPQYDYQSAEFDVSWSNLPEIPYPDNVQYFIQGRLNDGAASQPPEIYLGSSSDPPTSDIPVSFSFSGLQPETQYTATFEIVYNTTGSFRDFTRSGVTTTVSFTTLSDGSISEGDKAIINAIQNANKDNQQWIDSQFGSAVGDLSQDTNETDSLISGLDQQEEAYKDDAYDRFQELSSAFSGFDGSVGSGIGLAGTLFSRFFNALGSYKIIYTFPLLLGLAMVIIGRLGRSSIRMEREPGDQFKIDGW